MELFDMSAPLGATKKRKRIGRGESSGHGKTAGRGGKGQTARTGKGKPAAGFEGGQMPMYRRMPKRGFTNKFAALCAEVNIDLIGQAFPAGTVVTLELCKALGLARGRDERLRVLGRGEINHAVTVQSHHVTAGARSKIEAAGGRVEESHPQVEN
jgi:large subunit ribosomal protein L15